MLPMKVLLAGRPLPTDPVIGELQRSGAELHHCAQAGSATCSAVMGGPCALDGPIDVAVVRTNGLVGDDLGVSCAVRGGIPVVVVGRDAPGPFAAVAATVAQDEADVVDACNRAVDGESAAVASMLDRAITAAAPRFGLGEDAVRATARRVDGRLRVRLVGTSSTSRPALERIAVLLHDALRDAGMSTVGIDVSVHSDLVTR
jgi:hypothetical protein